jgi:ATP-binding cassette subfamily B protein
VVLISHRFSTVRTADRIHLVEHGRIVESGTHDELVALDGTYARMYEVQARAYQNRP